MKFNLGQYNLVIVYQRLYIVNIKFTFCYKMTAPPIHCARLAKIKNDYNLDYDYNLQSGLVLKFFIVHNPIW